MLAPTCLRHLVNQPGRTSSGSATFSTGAGERSVLLPAGTRSSLPSGWPVDLSSLVAEAPVGAEWLVVVQGKRDEEYSATLAALEPNGDTVSFGVLREGVEFGLVALADSSRPRVIPLIGTAVSVRPGRRLDHANG